MHNRIKQGINVEKEYAENIPAIECQSNALNQVWTNLINNGIEAMLGQGDIVIRVYPIEDAQKVVIEIEDHGPGIPDDVRERIFEPYFTTKPKGEGTGLGLAITMEILKKHNAEISLDTEPGKTCFKVTLPVKHIEETPNE